MSHGSYSAARGHANVYSSKGEIQCYLVGINMPQLLPFYFGTEIR